jgi:hypothetical protein
MVTDPRDNQTRREVASTAALPIFHSGTAVSPGVAMNRSRWSFRITDDMYARIPALLEQGMTKAQIAAIYGVKPTSLQVACSRRGISLRKGGPLLPRTSLSLPDESIPIDEDTLRSLREAARTMGKSSTARLVSDLLEKIARDGLYNAVLDDEAA